MWQPGAEDTHAEIESSSAREPEPQDRKEEAAAEPRTEYRGTGVMWGAIALVVLAAAFVIVAVQNSHDVEFDFLWLSVATPLALIIAVAIAISLVVGEVVGFMWRRQRRIRLQEREELRRLKKER